MNVHPGFDVPTKLRIRLFGVPVVEWEEKAVSVAVRPLCAVLLAMVVMTEPDRRLSRKAVAAELWPGDDEAAAAANLRRHLSFLIAALPAAEECIARDREALWCPAAAATWCDVLEFERGAVDLYRADFMEGFTHEWVLAQRERLRGAAVAALVRRAETFRESDDDAAAIACLRRAIEIDPVDESLAQFEIEVHGERGDTAAVDAAFDALARRLVDIDLTPARATVALVERFHKLARDAAARLPRPATSFVGSAALDDVAALVPACRLVTILGPGGVGKTRLSLEVAHKLAATFADGAFFVDLTTVTGGDALPAALARALGVPTDLASKGFSGIQTFLRNRRALLVLDNCEHVSEASSGFVNDVLSFAPRVHVLVTTREALGLRSERCYSLQPLSQADAIELFLGRASNAAWDGADRAEATSRIASVCKRLDRLPLALELAAGMLGTLSLADVERQLDEGLEHLKSRDRTTPARHRSLLDVIEWSVSLLDDRESDAFARLAVFAGSFSAKAAATVCFVDFATLAELVAKSVLVREDALEGRFIFLNSVGEFARRRFHAHPDAAAMRDAHATWFAALAMRSEEFTFWKGEREWLREIDRDFANMAVAYRWTILEGGPVREGLRLIAGLAYYFRGRGSFVDGIAWLRSGIERAEPGSVERAQLGFRLGQAEMTRGNFEIAALQAREACARLSEGGHDRDLARALNSEAAILLYLRHHDEPKALLKRALELARRCSDLRTEASINSNFAYLQSSTNDAAARESYVVALRQFEEVGDDGGVARILNSIAACDYNAERYEATNEYLERALAIHRDLGDEAAVAGVLSDLGDVAMMRDDVRAAKTYYAQALDLCRARDVELTYGSVLTGFAAIALAAKRPRDAARILGAARRPEDGVRTVARFRLFDRVHARIVSELGSEECDHQMAFGRNFSRGDATKLARSILQPIFWRA